MRGTPHIPIYDIWTDAQTRVRTPYKILRSFKKQRGDPHIPFEGIWSDDQPRVGTPHMILRCLEAEGDTTHSI